jgi:hypothetical protein
MQETLGLGWSLDEGWYGTAPEVVSLVVFVAMGTWLSLVAQRSLQARSDARSFKGTSEALRESERRLAAEKERLLVTLASIGDAVVSGYSQDAISHRGVLEAGLQFLPKPFTAPLLLERVRAVLDAPGATPAPR